VSETGNRTFHVAAPTIWNYLLSSIRSCDSMLTSKKHQSLLSYTYRSTIALRALTSVRIIARCTLFPFVRLRQWATYHCVALRTSLLSEWRKEDAKTPYHYGSSATHQPTYHSTYQSTDLLTARGVAHLVVHGTSGSTSYTKRFHPSDWRPLGACCRPWTWWCYDATASPATRRW